MNRSHLLVLLEQIQGENSRLKDDIIKANKQLNQLVNIMMQQLTAIGKNKAIYQSPLQCLKAYTQQFSQSMLDYLHKEEEMKQTRSKMDLLTRSNNELSRRQSEHRRKYDQLSQSYQTRLKEKEEKIVVVQQQLFTLRQQYKKAKSNYEKLVEEHQIQGMMRDQESRGAIAAAISSTKKQMIEFRQVLEEELRLSTQMLRTEIRKRDQTLKQLATTLTDQPVACSLAEVQQMKEVLDKVLQFNQLNKLLSNIRDQNDQLKKSVSDITNKKLIYQVRVNQLRTQLLNQESKFKRKNIQLKQLRNQHQKLTIELQRQKKGNKNLEEYYQEKWNREFQKVKKNLEKNYTDRINKNRQQVEDTKRQISKRILSYEFLHKEDQKLIQELRYEMNKKEIIISSHFGIINNLEQRITQLEGIICETNGMIIQSEGAIRTEYTLRLENIFVEVKQKQKVIEDLKTQKQQSNSNVRSIQDRMLIQFEQLKQGLDKLHKQELQKLIQEKQRQIEIAIKVSQIKDQEHQYKQQLIREQCRLAIKEVEKRYESIIQEKHIEKIQQIKYYKELVAASLKKQRTIKRQLQDLKAEYQQKRQFYQQEIENKKNLIKFSTEKGEKDHMLKSELRELADQKIAENKELNLTISQLMNEIEANKSEINHLGHQLEDNIFRRQEWVKFSLALEEELTKQFNSLKANHINQVKILKSKIWELQNSILNKPMRGQDKKKIRNLSERQRQLESVIQIKEAENTVLKQIKHHYQQHKQITKHQSEVQLNFVDHHRKEQPLLKIGRKPRRGRGSLYEGVNSQLGGTKDVQSDMMRMRNYLTSKQKEGSGSELKINKEKVQARITTVRNNSRSVDQ